MAHLLNARRQRVLRILVGRGGCFGKEMLDACNQVGRELHEAHRQVETVETKPGVLSFEGMKPRAIAEADTKAGLAKNRV